MRTIHCRRHDLPPDESLTVLLTHKSDRALKFKGRIVYDPLAARGGWVRLAGQKDDGPPWKNEWASSNLLEYEVVVGKNRVEIE